MGVTQEGERGQTPEQFAAQYGLPLSMVRRLCRRGTFRDYYNTETGRLRAEAWVPLLSADDAEVAERIVAVEGARVLAELNRLIWAPLAARSHVLLRMHAIRDAVELLGTIVSTPAAERAERRERKRLAALAAQERADVRADVLHPRIVPEERAQLLAWAQAAEARAKEAEASGEIVVP